MQIIFRHENKDIAILIFVLTVFLNFMNIMKKRIRLRYPLKTLTFLLACFISLSAWSQQQKNLKNNYVLILNAYSEIAPWSNSIITPVMHYISSANNTHNDLSNNLNGELEHVNMLLLETDSASKEYAHNLFAKYTHAPKLLILIGNGPLIYRDEFKKRWKDTPIIVCGEENFIGPDKYYVGKRKAIPMGERILLKDISEEFNLTLLQMGAYPEKTVELMNRMIPGMQKFIFLADEGYSNQEYNKRIKKDLEKKYPHIIYQRISPDEYSQSQLLDTLRNVDKKTGILFSSWSYAAKSVSGGSVSLGNAYRLLPYLPVPVFTLRFVGYEDGGMVGGYTYSETQYTAKLISTVDDVLNGKPAREIAFYYPGETAAPTFNYAAMTAKGLSTKYAPHNSRYYNKPQTFWGTYKWFILSAVFLLILFVMAQQVRIRVLRKIKAANEKEFELITKYRELINGMPILYAKEKILRDKSGNPIDTLCMDMNTAYERAFCREEEAIGKKGSELYPDILSDMLHFMSIALMEKRSLTFPYYYKKTDRFYDIVFSCSKEEDVLDVFCLDSSELHQAQQKLSSTNHKLSMALDVANITPWKWDLQKRTILCDVNKPIELSSFGNGDEEQFSVPDERYFAKICKEDRPRVEKAYQSLIEGKIDKVKEEYRVANSVGTGYRIDWVEAQAAVESTDESGKPLTLVGSSLIITERKKMEEELISAKDRAEESNRLKSAFLANMSHEIRTPLNAIVGFSSILASTDEEEERQEYVSIIENNNALLLQLIGDILDLSKIEAGALEFVYSDTDLNRTMEELESMMRAKNQSDRVKLHFKPSVESCQVYTEKNRITQVLINLISNSFKFTKEGTVEFGFEIRGKELYFYVKDTGCGIPADKHDSIFDRFVKLNNFAQGTGLGLPICKTIIQRMEGTIGVESEENKGSTFWFTIPYVPAKTKVATPKEHTPVPVKRDKLTILIAEDNQSNYLLFESILKRDYHLVHAWDGEEAVKLFKECKPHIVLMDINMPIMDGYEATKEIRKISKTVPVIAVTAYAYTSDEQKVMENGFDGFMPKPINASNLRSQITVLLQERIVLL